MRPEIIVANLEPCGSRAVQGKTQITFNNGVTDVFHMETILPQVSGNGIKRSDHQSPRYGSTRDCVRAWRSEGPQVGIGRGTNAEPWNLLCAFLGQKNDVDSRISMHFYHIRSMREANNQHVSVSPVSWNWPEKLGQTTQSDRRQTHGASLQSRRG